MKYLFREILGVDVDDVVKKVVATIAVERAKQAQKNTTDWKRYMEAEGGIVILPSNVTQGSPTRRDACAPVGAGIL